MGYVESILSSRDGASTVGVIAMKTGVQARLTFLVATVVVGCQSKAPQCRQGTIWLEDYKRCAFVCGSPEHPTSDDCYSQDAGSFIEAGLAEAGVADGTSSESSIDAPVQVVSDGSSDATAARTRDRSLSAPRAIAPMSTVTVTTTRPTLQWNLGAGSSVTIVELSRSRAFDVDVRRVEVEGETEVRLSALAAGVWFWRLRAATSRSEGVANSAVWWFRVGARDTPIDSFGGSSLDLDGDGLADIAVGGAGRVVVVRGTTSGPDPMSARVLEGTVPGDDFGQSIASAGDVNGDGYGDLIVGAGAPLGRSNDGYARVYFGGPMGISGEPAILVEGRSGDCFGSSVAGVGDMDGDGYGEIAVGVRGANGGAGLVRLYRGRSSGLDTTPVATFAGTNLFGAVLSATGDLNGDRRADLVIGALTANQATVLFGRATIDDFLPNQSLTVTSPVVRTNGFGSTVAGVGDVNGDGFLDVAVGAAEAEVNGASNAGMVRVFAGSVGGVQRVPLVEVDGVIPLTKLGAALAGGDINGDGFSDVLIGAPEDDQTSTDSGAVRVVFGASAMPGQMQTNVGIDLMGAARFGSAVSAAGDSDGDGLVDFIVAAPYARVAMGAASGAALWFRSNATRVPASPAQIIEAQRTWFGFARVVSN
jgi:hypothetical protein